MRRSMWLVLAIVVAACAPGGTGDREVDVERSSYGSHPDQHVVVHRPTTIDPGRPTVVLLHGGFWRERYRADLMTPLAEDLVAVGHVAVNVEYRRVGGAGGWPATLADVAAALDHLVELPDVGTDVIVTVGHSAGGHLAVWAASRHRLAAGAVGAGPTVRPCAAVSQAGVVDLGLAAERSLGAGAVTDLLGGGPDDVPDRYAVADPVALLPIGVPVLLLHGEDDTTVPPAVSRSYRDAAAAAGDAPELVVLPGDHFTVIDPSSDAWGGVTDRLAGLCPDP